MSATWKQNPLLLAEQIIKGLDTDGETSLDAIDARAMKHGINMSVLDKALERLHRNKHIARVVKKGTVYYSIKVVKKASPNSHLDWLRDNYPRIEPFVMPFPEIDMSWIILRPDEMKEYKAMAKGMPGYMMFKRKGV